MKARTRSVVVPLVLLAAVSVVVGYAYYGVERPNRREEARKETSEKIFSFAKDQVKELTVEAKGVTTKLARAAAAGQTSAGDWRIVSPIEAPADRGVVEALVDKVSSLRRQQVIESSAANLERYGLQKPSVRVALGLDGGKTETLALGEVNSFDQSLFVQPTSGAVDLVGGDAKWVLEKDLFELREKRLLVFEDRDLKRLEVTAPRLTFTVERAADGWKLTAPISEKAEQITVERIIRALQGLRATGFEQKPQPDREVGLDRPRYRVRLVDSAGAERQLSIGAPRLKKGAPEPTVLLARVGSARELASIQAEQVKDLDQDLWALRDKSVLTFDRDKVTAVRFESAGNSFEVQKKAAADGGAEEWALTSPRAAPARPWKMSGLIFGLSSLKASRPAEEAGKSPADFGLDRPSQMVTLLGADGSALAKLEVGKEAGDKVYVRGGGPRIWEVEKSRLSEIPKGVEDLEDKPAPEQKDAGP